MSLNNLEKFKQKLQRGELCVGVGVSFCDPAISELFAEVGYDFTFIDMEHTVLNLETVLGHVMAVRGTDTAPFVRVPWNDPVLIKPVLELEPAAIIVPMVRSAEEAAKAVAACKYPPKGVRGFGPCRGVRYGGMSTMDYLKDADERIMVIVQVEHIDAVNDLDAILRTPGLDGICLGPNDLSGSMGKLGQTNDPEVVAASDEVIAKTRRSDKTVGASVGYATESVRRWLAKGLHWIAVGEDTDNLYSYSKTALDDVRSIGAK
ncbi:MAG: 4-hydroxy-3-methylbut-2-en-1-yl diphosphate synthase [Verrucomicrobia bacterium]|nr:4-hydroxy-3-methylbut-2-en-1-yl diphosphate synthase [Verrucomicrobiota bacterium]